MSDELQRRVVRRIREVAREKGIAISHLPDRAGVSRAHFWNVLAGNKSPTLRWLSAVAGALEIDAGDLFAKRGRTGAR